MALDSVGPVHWPENMTIRKAGRRGSSGDLATFYPHRHRQRARAAVLAYEVDGAPATVALLYVCDRERRYLGKPEPTAEEDGQDGMIAQKNWRIHPCR